MVYKRRGKRVAGARGGGGGDDVKQNVNGDGDERAGEDARVEELKDEGYNYYRNIF